MNKNREEIYILADPLYMSTFWCTKCIEGLKTAALKNHLNCNFLTEIEEVYENRENIGALIVISARTDWLKYAIHENKKMGIRTIMAGTAIESFDDDISGSVIDRKQTMEELMQHFFLRGKKRMASVGNKPDDFNDVRRCELFLKIGQSLNLPNSSEDVFYDYCGIDVCVNSFLRKVKEYDAAICVNDYVAVVLACEAQKRGIKVPEDLYICGSGNMMIGMCCEPSITTSTLNYYEMGVQAVSIWMILNREENITSIRITLPTDIIWRDSTCGKAGEDNTAPESSHSFDDMQILATGNSNVERIEACLQQCDSFDYKIIDGIIKDKSFEIIAEELFASTGAIYYRLKKIYSGMGVKNKSEFGDLIKRYISTTDKLLEKSEK